MASGSIRVLFDSLRDLSDQCGGRGEEGKGERRKWIVPSPISGSSGWLNIGVGNYL